MSAPSISRPASPYTPPCVDEPAPPAAPDSAAEATSPQRNAVEADRARLPKFWPRSPLQLLRDAADKGSRMAHRLHDGLVRRWDGKARRQAKAAKAEAMARIQGQAVGESGPARLRRELIGAQRAIVDRDLRGLPKSWPISRELACLEAQCHGRLKRHAIDPCAPTGDIEALSLRLVPMCERWGRVEAAKAALATARGAIDSLPGTPGIQALRLRSLDSIFDSCDKLLDDCKTALQREHHAVIDQRLHSVTEGMRMVDTLLRLNTPIRSRLADSMPPAGPRRPPSEALEMMRDRLQRLNELPTCIPAEQRRALTSRMQSALLKFWTLEQAPEAAVPARRQTLAALESLSEKLMEQGLALLLAAGRRARAA